MFPTDIPLHCIISGDWVLLKTWKNQYPENQLQPEWSGQFPDRAHSPSLEETGGPNRPNAGGKPTTDFPAPRYTCGPLTDLKLLFQKKQES